MAHRFVGPEEAVGKPTGMAKQYFGTDGIRGRANTFPMTAEVAMKVGMAVGVTFRRGAHRNRVVIGKDTRLSGYMLENAMVAGFTAAGMDVFLLGPVPTPAVAMLTRSLRADLGVMISASHNPYQDNGIKLFGPDGYKLSDDAEAEIEARVDSDMGAGMATAAKLGRARRLDDAQRRLGLKPSVKTFPSSFPAIRIDHAFVSPEVQVTGVRSSFSPLARMASDHLPLIVDFELPPASA